MTIAVNNVQRNCILNDLTKAQTKAMTNADLCLLQPPLIAVPLKFRQRLQGAHRSIETVDFLASGLASVAGIGGERRQASVAVLGREGMDRAPDRGITSIRDHVALEECANRLYGPPVTEYERLFD